MRWHVRSSHALLLAVSVCCLTGCSPTILDLRDELDLFRSSYRERLAPHRDLAQQFLSCTTQLANDPADTAQFSGARTFGSIRSLIAHIRERRPQKADALLALLDLADEFADISRRRVAFDRLQTAVEVIRTWGTHLHREENVLTQDASRFSQLLEAYYTAYFGNLRFIGDPAGTTPGRRGVKKVTSKGFVDRSGDAWLFPGLSPDPDQPGQAERQFAATVSSQRLSADLTRIFIEAFFDAAFQVPAVRGATALEVEWPAQIPPYPEFDADRPAIPLDALARLTGDALRAEAAVTATVGKAVRGGSVFGAQNETLAASLETAAGVLAKKLVEHEGFCYFQVIHSKPVAGEMSVTPSESAALSDLLRHE